MKKMYLNLLKTSNVFLVFLILFISPIIRATTCPSAVVIPSSTSFPSAAITLVCGTTNDITGLGGSGGGKRGGRGGAAAAVVRAALQGLWRRCKYVSTRA